MTRKRSRALRDRGGPTAPGREAEETGPPPFFRGRTMEDYHRLFPDCERCRELHAQSNAAIDIYYRGVADGAYAQHLLDHHNLTAKDILNRTGVILIWSM